MNNEKIDETVIFCGAVNSISKFWKTAEINGKEQARVSAFSVSLSRMYPDIVSMAAELNYTANTGIDLLKEQETAPFDVAGNVFELSQKIERAADALRSQNPQAASFMADSSRLEKDVSLVLKSLSEQEGTDDCAVGADRLRIALEFQRLSNAVEEQLVDGRLYEELVNVDVRRQVWESLCLENAFSQSADIEVINMALFTLCKNLGSINRPVSDELMDSSLLKNLRRLHCVRRNLEKIALPGHIKQTLKRIIGNSRSELQMNRRLQHYLQKVWAELPENRSRSEIDRILIARKLSGIEPEIGQLLKSKTFLNAAEENYPLQNTATVDGKDKNYWAEYEKEAKYSKSLRRDMVRLTTAWLFCKDEAAAALQEKFARMAEETDDGEEWKGLEARMKEDLLDFAGEMLISMKAGRKYLGLNLNEEGIELRHLHEIRKKSGTMDETDLQTIEVLFESFEDNLMQLEDGGDYFLSLPVSNSFIRELKKMPEGLDKFEAAFFSKMALKDLAAAARSEEREYQEFCLDDLRRYHREDFELLRDFVGGYFRGRQIDAEKIADRLDRGIADNFILPLYGEERRAPNTLEQALAGFAKDKNMTETDRKFLRSIGKYHASRLQKSHAGFPALKGKFIGEACAYWDIKRTRNNMKKILSGTDAVYRGLLPEYRLYKNFKEAERHSVKSSVLTMQMVGMFKSRENR